MTEIWKDIQGYEGFYQISNLGNVKSLERVVDKGNGILQHRKERIMNKRESVDGYYIAKLNVNKKSTSIAIHILVARHFIDNPNNYPEVNHKDCNRKNNQVDNLEWCTHQQNVEHSKQLGHYKTKSGCDNPNYKNDTLKIKYKNNPTLAKINNSRPREQNGRCVKIRMMNNDVIKDFNFIGEAAEYLIVNGYTDGKINSIRSNITNAIKNNKKYLGCTFERL